MSDKPFRAGRWIAVALAMIGLAVVFYNLVMDNMPKGETRRIEGYVPWSKETLLAVESIPVQDGGRIKPLSTYAGFTMLALHGARSMEIEGAPQQMGKFKRFLRQLRGKSDSSIAIKPTAWLMDALFRPQWAIQQPTFRVDNSAALEAIGVPPRGRRDRYSYADLRDGREKLGELAQSYRGIDAKKRDPMQNQVVDLAANVQVYESLLGYFSFARNGVVLRGSGENGEPDKRAQLSALMATAPTLRGQLAKDGHGQSMEPRLRALLEQVLDAANFAKFGLFLVPPPEGGGTWLSAGNVIMGVMSGEDKDPARAIEDIQALESAVHALEKGEESFRASLAAARDRFVERAKARGEYRSVPLEAAYYHKNWFLYALVWFLLGTLAALAMWAFGRTRAGSVFAWVTGGTTLAGLVYCTVAIVKRCIIMERPPVGNLYDTIIFIGATMVLLGLVLEWLTRRRFALGLTPMIGLGLIILARRFELGDARDHMDPLVAVLDSNFWLTTHVITITLGYSAGLLSAFLSAAWVLMRGLGLDDGEKDLRRALTRTVYGMLCFTLFLSLVGTVLGGIWANYSWGRFWGWDPKENGALMIVLWTLAILHARLGGYLKDWGIHLSSVFTAVIVTFSWWHVNFLGVGLHNYGFTAGKNTIWAFYAAISAVLVFGFVVRAIDQSRSSRLPGA